MQIYQSQLKCSKYMAYMVRLRSKYAKINGDVLSICLGVSPGVSTLPRNKMKIEVSDLAKQPAELPGQAAGRTPGKLGGNMPVKLAKMRGKKEQQTE